MSLTAAIWLGLIVMIAIGVRVGPDHAPNPRVPRLFGWANRLLTGGVWRLVDRRCVALGALTEGVRHLCHAAMPTNFIFSASPSFA